MKIGPSFAAELAAAGLGNGMSWDAASGDLFFMPDVSSAAQAQAKAVLAAHDPTKAAPRSLADIDAALDAIDAKTARASRDFALTGDKTRLQQLETQAAQLRTERAALAASS